MPRGVDDGPVPDLYVNQFVSSSLNWTQMGVHLIQSAGEASVLAAKRRGSALVF